MGMFENILAPLILTEALESVNGKTRFQKLMFLIQKTAAKEKIMESTNFSFSLYLYGPFSQDLSSAIDDLVRSGYLNEFVEQNPPSHELHVYRLTDKGRDFLEDAKAKKLVSRDLTAIVRSISQKYGALPLRSLVDEAYKQF